MSDHLKDRTNSAINATRDRGTWTYAGWCDKCTFRAIDPGRRICAACSPWVDPRDLQEWEHEMGEQS